MSPKSHGIQVVFLASAEVITLFSSFSLSKYFKCHFACHFALFHDRSDSYLVYDWRAQMEHMESTQSTILQDV
jgi:hypothetical protein